MIKPFIALSTDEYRSTIFHPDETLLLVAINDLFERNPKKFGNIDVQEALRSEIAECLKNPPQSPFHPGKTILPFLGDLFEAYGLKLFENVRLAFLACNDGTLKNAEKIRSSFSEFTDFDPDRTEPLSVENWDKFAGTGKYDYALTGNVLNDPKIGQSVGVAYITTGIASLLKKDGLAIHALNHSGDNYDFITSDSLLRFCGQRIEGKLNVRATYSDYLVDAVILLQEKEVSISTPYFLWAWQSGVMSSPPERQSPQTRYFVENPALLEKVDYNIFSLKTHRKKDPVIQQINQQGEVTATYTPQEFFEWFADFQERHSIQPKSPKPAALTL